MLKDKDRIFKNLYNDMGSDVTSSKKRGDWVNTKEIIDKVRGLKNQGASDEKYWYKEVGYNYRMTNICAAIGLSQIEQIEGILLRKKEIADMYKLLLNDYPVEFQDIQSKGESSYWLTSILTEESQIKDDLSDFLSLSGIETRPLFYPAHTMPMYKTDIVLIIHFFVTPL